MSAEKIIGHINSTESFGSVDGPGVRFIFFLQGCPMRCKYCHNPETWAVKGGDEMTAQEAFDLAYKYKNYWKGGGGITVSGGEAMLRLNLLQNCSNLLKSTAFQRLLIPPVLLLHIMSRSFQNFRNL